ncbi:MAG: polysaccharide pyruvyl transferase family protein [Actinomycetes bacterium]
MPHDSGDLGSPPLRVALLGNFGIGNLGNDASLDALIQLVRRADPDVSITVVCTNPDVVRTRFGVPAYATRSRRPQGRLSGTRLGALLELPGRLADVRQAFRVCGTVDALVAPGTGILDDFGSPKPTGWPLGLFVWMGAARLRRTRTALVSVGAGPLRHPVSRRFARWASSMADHRSFRDRGSRAFMMSIGLDVPADEVVPDIVFSLPSPEATRPPSARPLVAVPVMNYSGWQASAKSPAIAERNVETLTSFCLWLLGEGYAVRLVTADASDEPATDEVAARVRAAEPERADVWLTTAVAVDLPDLMCLLTDAVAVVATRYHSVVSGLICGKPTISLGYGAKNTDLMQTVGLGAFCQHVEHVDQELLRGQLTEAVADAPRLSRLVASRVEELRAQLEGEEQRLQASVLGSRRRVRARRRG